MNTLPELPVSADRSPAPILRTDVPFQRGPCRQAFGRLDARHAFPPEQHRSENAKPLATARSIISGVLFLALGFGFPAGVPAAEPAELEVIRERLDYIEESLERLEQEWEEFGRASLGDTHPGDIPFPGTNDRGALSDYVRAILATAQNRQSMSSNDVQVAMLKRIGSENADILFDAIEGVSIREAYYALRALEALAGEDHKEAVLANLRQHPSLVEIVIRHDWQNDARDILFESASSGYFVEEWLGAIAAIGDEEARTVLLSAFVESRSGLQHRIYEIIRDVDSISEEERAEAVREAWVRSEHDHRQVRMSLAQVAIGYGHRDALDLLMDIFREDSLYLRQRQELLAVLRIHTDGGHTRARILDWFQENRSDLTFDAERRVFSAR